MKTLLLLATLAGHAADLTTTEIALRRGSGVEGNPLMRQPVVRYVAKGGVASFQTYVTAKLWTSGHRRMAVIITTATVITTGAVAAHNLHVR